MKNDTKLLIAKMREKIRPVFIPGFNSMIKQYGDEPWFDKMIEDYNSEVVEPKGIVAPLTYCQNWTIKFRDAFAESEVTPEEDIPQVPAIDDDTPQTPFDPDTAVEPLIGTVEDIPEELFVNVDKKPAETEDKGKDEPWPSDDISKGPSDVNPKFVVSDVPEYCTAEEVSTVMPVTNKISDNINKNNHDKYSGIDPKYNKHYKR